MANQRRPLDVEPGCELRLAEIGGFEGVMQHEPGGHARPVLGHAGVHVIPQRLERVGEALAERFFHRPND